MGYCFGHDHGGLGVKFTVYPQKYVGLFGGADNAAHFGGLISGFLMGGLLALIEKDKLKENLTNKSD